MRDDVDDYLKRIGATRPWTADAAALADLQERHLMSVPFENLDVHLGVPIELGQAAVDKVVRRRRGGGCRELNASAFPFLLGALGFTCVLLGGRVYRGGRPGIPPGHVLIRVEASEPWLVDVGFGAGSLRPLRLDERGPQHDPRGTFRFVEAPHGDLDLLRDGEPVYRIESHPREADDFRPMVWWYRNSPDSPYARHLFCTLVTETGRITISNDTLVTTVHGNRYERRLTSAADTRRAYLEHFGITLDRLPPVPQGLTNPIPLG
ncbi:arylamine N-acetyltransferase family protein [Embleya hyalina]|uniref:N-hydroxyarylamine O-acetyltransferase n=1 Tax=Embleya hyalina TaxID=516124 RepID=A0A401Z1K6_9ACTN|nr:arylamine N-acetyltransferase [Embleya hyalina]GCE00727.1 N-hydroxyarylamine O-acetyltransferase [Embleya hyalina]